MSPRRKACAVLAAGCVATGWNGALVFGYPGLMAARWQEAFGVGRAALSAVLFFMLAALGLGMFVVGRLQARMPFWRLVLAGEVLCAASLLIPARATGIGGIYVWGFLVGVSSCLIYMPSLTAAQLWWPARRGFASGTLNMCFAISAAALAPVFARLLEAYGEGPTHLVVGAAILVVGGPAALFIAAPPAPSAAHRPAAQPPTPSLTARQSLRTRAFWLLWGTWALQGAAGIAMVSLAGALVRWSGAPAQRVVGVLVGFNLANGVSRFVAGALSDRLGRRLSLSLPFAAAGGAYLLLSASPEPAFVGLLAGVVGFAFGTLFAVSGPLALECFGPLHFGSVYGLVFTAYGFLAGVLGPYLSGLAVDLCGGNPAPACVYLAFFCLLSALLVWGITPGRLRALPDVAPARD